MEFKVYENGKWISKFLQSGILKKDVPYDPNERPYTLYIRNIKKDLVSKCLKEGVLYKALYDAEPWVNSPGWNLTFDHKNYSCGYIQFKNEYYYNEFLFVNNNTGGGFSFGPIIQPIELNLYGINLRGGLIRSHYDGHYDPDTIDFDYHPIIKYCGKIKLIILNLLKYLEQTEEFSKRIYTENTCVICEKNTNICCKNCKMAFYCCREHQKLDWEGHKHFCSISNNISKLRKIYKYECWNFHVKISDLNIIDKIERYKLSSEKYFTRLQNYVNNNTSPIKSKERIIRDKIEGYKNYEKHTATTKSSYYSEIIKHIPTTKRSHKSSYYSERRIIRDFKNYCVIHIQRVARGFITRNRLHKTVEERKKENRIIIKNFIIKIQKIVRGFITRKKLFQIVEEREKENRIRGEFAIKIQKIFRCFVIRNILYKAYSPFNKIKKRMNKGNIKLIELNKNIDNIININNINININNINNYYNKNGIAGNIKVKKSKKYKLGYNKSNKGNKINNKINKIEKKKKSSKNQIITNKKVKHQKSKSISPNKRSLNKKNKKKSKKKVDSYFLIPPPPLFILEDKKEIIQKIKNYDEIKLGYKNLPKVIYDKFKYSDNSGNFVKMLDINKKSVYLNLHGFTKSGMRKQILEICRYKILRDEYYFQGIFVNIGRGEHGKLRLREHLMCIFKKWKNNEEFEFKNRLKKLKVNKDIIFELKEIMIVDKKYNGLDEKILFIQILN